MVNRYHSPRASFTSYLYTILKVLHSSLNIIQEDIFESIKELEKTGQKINSLNLNKDNPALKSCKLDRRYSNNILSIWIRSSCN